MKCPKCADESLERVKIRETEVDRCPRCCGLWFDENELRTLLGIEPSELRSLETQTVYPSHNSKPSECPRDGDRLLRVMSRRNRVVVMDVCPSCRGIWLDGGEIQLLTAQQ
ncbi:MAG TPA: zf-TFIIB domain-containing protein [Candidatus Paceibacterota bacterium]|nr:zf-TFIIB domain-containing protein [Verrucomicrobiota bacterium]HRY47018.1 zf-TFIIB domain-containing protein [Candidatus Paceibacterota bacterium]HSA03652.1 zf-TFIIB domain-containing protein [Candidatus Paceibacterota bacterium]